MKDKKTATQKTSNSDEISVSDNQIADASGGYSLAVKQEIRDQLTKDIEAFLEQGGQVKSIADNVRADPPRKPDMAYGSNPI